MNFTTIIGQLQTEKSRLETAITTLQTLQAGDASGNGNGQTSHHTNGNGHGTTKIGQIEQTLQSFGRNGVALNEFRTALSQSGLKINRSYLSIALNALRKQKRARRVSHGVWAAKNV